MQRTQNDSASTDLLDMLDVELLTSIQAHVEERGSSASAYVVPMNRIFIQDGNTDERCVVVFAPHTARKDVRIEQRRIYTDVRTTPDRKHRACLMLADGAVALTEAAVVGAAPLRYGRLVVFWIFADDIVISEYPYLDVVDEALRRTSRVADTDAYQVRRGVTFHLASRQTAVEVFDSFDVDSYIPGEH
ncbi:hypothetical protein [Paraburkholderia caribensis]|uniref:hypothetical protein n=1 Tax=Paraburkholderia caribensis TaxID=75105 RepID=UPI001590236B|nr:hypothetical protein [Paraburkholderia caribensis]